jgi:hypothetical protein
MLIIVPINDRIELLPYFLRYYSSLGVTQFVCGLFNGESNPHHAAIKAWSARHPLQIRNSVCADMNIRNSVVAGRADHYCSDIDGPGLNRIREEFAADHRWYAIADLDEFHSFGGPTLPEAAAEAERRGCEAVHGVFCDRISADGGFPEINGPLDGTFPLGCNLTARTGHWRDKIVLARSHVPITVGHHTAAAKVWRNVALVHHFKWSRGVDTRVAANYRTTQAKGIGWMLRALPPVLEVIANGVNLSDPLLHVAPAPKLGI